MDKIPQSGSYHRHFSHYDGLYFDEFCSDSVWLRDTAVVQLPPLGQALAILIRGEIRHHPTVTGLESGYPSIACKVDGASGAALDLSAPGPFSLKVTIPVSTGSRGAILQLALGGVALTNSLAWLGRVTGWSAWQRFRAQNKNRQLRLTTIETLEGEIIFDFSNRNAPYSGAFARNHSSIGLNIVGFLTAELGVGESARCMVRAADAAQLATALVPLKLNCKNRLGDTTYATRLQAENPHKFNVVHLDPPASRDIDHHHGKEFRSDKYNIAYWAWELPEFPDSWVPACAYFDEIWCPSDFARDAIAMKVALPVITMPHAISFARPTGDLRPRFGLPADKFLFLVLYDLNSYSERKNPGAVIAAFRQSGLAGPGAALVLKVHNVPGNEADLRALQAAVADLPRTIIIAETLAREEVYLLEAACDCYVSLHRSEGFGLAVAECMYLGKPVISTDWSATAEFVNTANGCPVNYTLCKLERNYGPYGKGQTWAEADVDHAAHWMQQVATDQNLAARIGSAARATIESRFAPAVIGARYRRRLENITTW
ncbi:MAG: glycosyltransferase family 4 protein [Cephaloticoccus sp.]|nr:glycosyltransferase family 4 protein [Cephaloticoccus sp.]